MSQSDGGQSEKEVNRKDKHNFYIFILNVASWADVSKTNYYFYALYNHEHKMDLIDWFKSLQHTEARKFCKFRITNKTTSSLQTT